MLRLIKIHLKQLYLIIRIINEIIFDMNHILYDKNLVHLNQL